MLRYFGKRDCHLGAALLGCLLMGGFLGGCESLEEDLAYRDQALTSKPRDLRRLNLTGADMRRSKLVNADLSESVLLDANFQGNDLSALRAVAACFDRANMSETNLGWASLRGSSLRGTNLFRSNLFQSDLRGADLSAADLSGAFLRNAHLMGTQLASAKGLKPELMRDAACWDQRTAWPADWVPPSPERVCEKHAAPGSEARSTSGQTKVTNSTKLLLRERD